MALVVDAANVVGSRPDGWWRDRAGATRRLLLALSAALLAGALDGPIVVVLEGAARAGAPAGPGQVPELRVVHADADGDSAIVDEITAMVTEATEASESSKSTEQPVVVTSDRRLRERVEAAGAAVLSPSWLLERLRP